MVLSKGRDISIITHEVTSQNRLVFVVAVRDLMILISV